MLTPATESIPAWRLVKLTKVTPENGKSRLVVVIGFVWAGVVMPNWLRSPTRSLAK